MEQLPLIGYASGIAANTDGCGDGPLRLQQSSLLTSSRYSWIKTLLPDLANLNKLAVVANLNQKLAKTTRQLVNEQQFFAVIGGDHSSAIGTWSGVAAALAPDSLGLLWLDAHLDSHTFETTHSGNIHGMPLACLLGYGDPALTQISLPSPKIKPEHICIIGARSYEPEEHALLKQLQVKIFYMEDIKRQGLSAVLEQGLKIVTNGTAGYGISIDLDAIDPTDAPGVSYPEPDGINGRQLCAALQQMTMHPGLTGIEITEFNPYHDEHNLTEQLIFDLLQSFREYVHEPLPRP